VLYEKKILNETNNHNPPFKLNGRSLRKYKYKQYRQSLIDKLDSLHEENPKLYWNIVNEHQGKREKVAVVLYHHQL
jgi:3-methyladenine DNA glycosylase AlkC